MQKIYEECEGIDDESHTLNASSLPLLSDVVRTIREAQSELEALEQ